MKNIKTENIEPKEDYFYSKLFVNIKKHISIDAYDKEFLKSIFTVATISSKELVLQQGELCRKLVFVASGSLRAYNLTSDGKEATVMFAIEDWWITDMHSFSNQKAALVSVETLERSTILSINFEQFEILLHKIPKFERFFRILFQNAYVREQIRALDSISLSTEERFSSFKIKYPQVVEKVTQKQIASYLGVTPEFLSAVKKNKHS